MSRFESIVANRWPVTPDFLEIARSWAQRLSRTIIALVWEASDYVLEEIDSLSFEDDPVQVERQLAFLLHNRLAVIRDPRLPFVVIHEPPEFEMLERRQASPPQPDLGFVMNGTDRVVWPVEMKVLSNDADVGAYSREVRENFVTGRYAPFTGEGALLGCLLNGEPTVAFVQIASTVPCELEQGFSHPRAHMISNHTRNVSKQDLICPTVRCHHLLLLISLQKEDC